MTVRDNILFNKQFSCALYEQAVTCCQLKQDFKMLQSGDLTEIGERVRLKILIDTINMNSKVLSTQAAIAIP